MAGLADITAADLKARYPVFQGVADPLITAVLSEARGSVTDAWIEADRVPALLALAAHLMTREGVLADLDPLSTNGGFGTVQSMKAGDHEIRFSGSASAGASSSRGSEYGGTAFGIRYLELYMRSFPAIMVV